MGRLYRSKPRRGAGFARRWLTSNAGLPCARAHKFFAASLRVSIARAALEALR